MSQIVQQKNPIDSIPEGDEFKEKIKTFGDDIVVVEPLPPVEVIQELQPQTPQKKDTTRKVNKIQGTPAKLKPGKFREYIMLELVNLDELWNDASFNWNLLQDMHYDEHEDKEEERAEKLSESLWDYMHKLEGQMDALFQLGRFFGISQKDMVKAMACYAGGVNDGSVTDTTKLARSVVQFR